MSGAASAVDRLGSSAIGVAAAASHAAGQAAAMAAMQAGRCTQAGCQSLSFQRNLCFEHHRLDQIKKGGGGGRAVARRPVASANKGTIVELVSSVRSQPEFARMVGYSIECIKKLAVDEVAVEEILEQGTIQALEHALAKHPNNEKLHKQYMEALEAFSLNGRLARQVGQLCSNNFNKLGHSLRTHNDVDTHIATAKAMAALAEDPANMDHMADQGVLDALADAVRRNPNNADLLAAAAKVFSKFAAYKPEYADFITRSGATEVIIVGMQAHPQHNELARNGAELLSILAGTGAYNLTALKAMGAVDALIAALEAHPYDKELEDYATRALALLTGEDDMVRALSVVSGDMQLDLAAAKALSKVSSLLLVANNVDTMFRVKGVDWLVALLNVAEGLYDANGNRILEHGLRALARAATDVNKVYDILKHGGVQLLINLLNTRTDKDILAAALAALARLVAGREDNAFYIINNGGANAVLRAYASYPNDGEIVRPALDFLAACTFFEGIADSLVGCGSIEALIDVLRRHMLDVAVVKKTIEALGRLATSEENVRRMAQSGLLPLLLTALRTHAEDEEAVRTALLAIETAALLPENIAALLALGAVDAIRAAMARFPLNKDIQDIGARALALLLRAQQDDLERARLAALERARLEELERLRREQEAELERLRREQEERDRLAREMAEALARLKLQDEAEEAERKRRQQKEWEDDIKLKAMREKQEAEDARLAALVAPKKAPEPAKKATHRSARALFEGDDDDEPPVFELDPSVKQFLLEGQMVTKHSKTALPASRHVYLSQDLVHVIWNRPMQEIHAKNTMLVTSVYAVTPGHTTPQLQRVRFGQPLAGPEEHCFSICGASAGTGIERTVDIECRSRADRDKWIHAFEQLIRWVKTRKLYGTSTVKMTSSEKIFKKVAKEQAAAGRP